MKQPKTVLEILGLVDKSNCRECGAPACMAFAASVLKGDMTLEQCPKIDPAVLKQYGGTPVSKPLDQSDVVQVMENLKKQLASIDLDDAAKRTNGRLDKGKLIIRVFGKEFGVDSAGRMSSDIHINQWIGLPVLSYILEGKGHPFTGKWVPFRELDGGRDWDNFFTHRFEKPLKKIADTYPDLFEDLIHIFNGREVTNHYQADISLVISPLPMLPVLICYWKPEDGMPSSLNVFFDSTADKNLPIRSIYLLCTGLVEMFGKIALRHGVPIQQ